MIAAGVFVALGLAFLWFKLSWKARLWMNSHPVLIDVVVFSGLTAIHWGTFTGVMAATIGALACSAMLSAARWAVGYTTRTNGIRVYVRGKFNFEGLPS